MGAGEFFCLMVISWFLFLPQTCLPSVLRIGKVSPGFQGHQMQFVDNNGLFLLSNSSDFGFGFNPNSDVTSFTLVIIHRSSSRIIWSANRDFPVGNSDNFVFTDDGNASLESKGKVLWSTNTAKKGVSAMELLDSGNLVLVKDDGVAVWQSFSYPTNTLMPNQDFLKGMKLVSNLSNNLSFSLQINTGDAILSAEFNNPQPYWSMGKDKRRIINKSGGDTTSAKIEANSWRFYDENEVFLWQFLFADESNANATWIAVLEDDGFIKFYNLKAQITATHQIPDDSCSRPQACPPYYVCHDGNTCQCPVGLAQVNCTPQIVSSCNKSKDSASLVNAGENVSYFALGFVSPSSKTDLDGCKSSCLNNCTCLAVFFDNNSGKCYQFDQIGSFKDAKDGANIESYIKVSGTPSDTSQGRKNKNQSTQVVIIVIIIVSAAMFVILGLVIMGIRYQKKKKNESGEVPDEISEEDTFLENISGMPVRFSHKDLQEATNDFTTKLGQGGFGSVYQGVLKDGTRLAVKRLEGIGQGKKQFRAEVSIIGSIHHHHLVKLKGFCAEGTHRLLVYEYMANGSLDRWIFGDFLLDWDTRYNIAIGTAKGLAYLHEDCDVKIVHCDIKPENVLLDDNFLAKVSDFGLAKLMTREQSHVFTTLRGTRGYLAPEWITNYAISEKSDVYSYGMVLLEIISGRRNYSSSETSHFPAFASKMMEEGKVKILLDQKMKVDENDERVVVATRVALWCIQDDMNLRPSMTKVVQMLEGLCPVPAPPVGGQMGFFSSWYKPFSEFGTSSGPSDDENHVTTSYGRRIMISMITFLLPLPKSMQHSGANANSADDLLLLQGEIRKVLSKSKAAGVLRLVFHDAGTYEMDDDSGGMNGSISYELDRPENKGLKKSLKILVEAKKIVDEKQSVSMADMIAVAGAEAVFLCGGPHIPVQLGRLDSMVPDPEGKLPEETLNAFELKQSFQRKGFSTQELVALSGAHTLGSKGFGNPVIFDNAYYKVLLEKPWLSSAGMTSMVGLPSDRSLVEDDECLRWISKYADDQDLFFEDFKNAYIKLVHSGATWRRNS